MHEDGPDLTNPTLPAESLLLDVTRLIELRWTGRQPNGIDRVCLEYVRHFGSRAQAVVQHRGVIRVLGTFASRSLLHHLIDPQPATSRAKIAAHVLAAMASSPRARRGSLYLNVSHTDFDLPAHTRWIERQALRAIYLVHDLIPILYPEHCRRRAVVRHCGRVRAALQHASGIIVGSAAVADDLNNYADLHRLSVPPVAVAPLAGAKLPCHVRPPERADDYFLCVGTIESRKNHLLLLKVWERLHLRMGCAAPRLVIVGRWGAGSGEFREALGRSSAAGLIEVREDCTDDQLVALMLGARAMLMPSLAEGFGLPMAEALALNVPVIASDLPCFREVGQGVPHLLDPHDVSSWESRIGSLDSAASQRQRRIDALHGYCPPTWDEHFGRLNPWLATISAQPVRTSTISAAADAPTGRDPITGSIRVDLEI